MDVRCERCSTEYEFDDALVSGRGTTVKCTNCGHKFKIRPRSGDFSEDFWNVQTGDGRTLVFTSLRELQRAIQTNLVDRNDLLSRGGLQQKAIGQIPELAPFFDQRDQRKSLPVPPAPVAVSPASAGQVRSSRPPPPPGAWAPPLAPPRQRMSTRPDFPPPPDSLDHPPVSVSMVASMKRTLIGTGTEGDVFGAPAPQPQPAQARVATEPPPPRVQHVENDTVEPDTQPFTRERAHEAPPAVAAKPLSRTQPIEPVRVPMHSPAPPPFEASSPLPPPTPPVLRSMNLDDEQTDDAGGYDSDGIRARSPSIGDDRADGPISMGRRRSVGGFIVAAVVVAGVALIGAVWAKDHLGGVLGARPAPVATSDQRAAGLLATGDKALADGNLEAAKESFDKASALAEKDPHVLLDVARLASMRADVPWLRSRLLAPDAADDVRVTKDALAELSAAARKAADDALAVAPDDPAALRTKIDALRIAGDRDGARALVGKVASSASQPETAYVLAALDLAENEPLWSTVIERLRVAASAESGPGRARAALAYALARSGDVAAAKSEVERLSAMTRPHPLLPLLRSFADRAKPIAKVDVGGLDAGAPGALAAAPDAGRPGRERAGGGGGGEPADRGRLSGDGRQLVAQGEAARAKGDYDRAQTLFAAALDKNPNDAEALAGLAAIAHARRDLNGARASYKRVLSINPSYVPALVGVGDVDWESGDRASAMKTYKEIVDRFPEGTYPPRVRQRVEAGSAPAPAPAPAPTETGGGG
ncbi:MAG: repeat protein [Labilithrix sp.]|nr:repeat protein [Labilithrix sp.]